MSISVYKFCCVIPIFFVGEVVKRSPESDVDCVLKCDGTRAETRFRLPAKRTSPFKSAGGSVQSITGRRAVHISLQGLYCSCKPMFCSHVTLTGYPLHSILLFPIHFSSRASPCAITFQTHSSKISALHSSSRLRSALQINLPS